MEQQHGPLARPALDEPSGDRAVTACGDTHGTGTYIRRRVPDRPVCRSTEDLSGHQQQRTGHEHEWQAP